MAKYLDETGLQELVVKIKAEDAKKVDKVSGKGLSSNDYTSAEKQKLADIAAGAEVNVQSDWNVTDSTSDAFIKNKPDLSGFITNTVDNLTNYYKKTETYTQVEVNTLIGNLKTIEIQIVQTLPSTGQSNIIYLVPKTGGHSANIYTEYVWISGNDPRFEIIGDTEVDLSGYVQKTTKVNGHALSSDVTVTASDVGLGSVVNTGDSATPVSGGTTKFTTGGAYTELAKKVDKVTGKGLSTNDYTTTEKNKLSGIESGAQVNVIEGVQVDGVDLTPSSKKVNVVISGKLDKNGFSTQIYQSKNRLSANEIYIDAQEGMLIEANGQGKTITLKDENGSITLPQIMAKQGAMTAITNSEIDALFA